MEKPNTEDKLEFWKLVVEEFENSEKSIKEQCEENDIALGQYYNWRKKVRGSQDSEVGTFVEVSEAERSPIDNKSGTVILEYRENFKIKLDDGFNPETLGSDLQVLMSL